jgi:choline dehydrogenase-like flavoprotein
MTRRAVESDVCIIGSGISAAMVADKLSRKSKKSIVVVEAGDDLLPPATRAAARERYLAYGENPWANDHLDGLEIEGPLQSRSMLVGGMAMHWGGVTPRFSPDDFRHRSRFGVGDDWPISYEDLDPYYQEAEELMGVAGEQGPAAMDPRGKPFPMPALPLSYNLTLLKDWASKGGIATWSQPSAKTSTRYKGRPPCCRNDTCYPICPIGAKYSPDMTWRPLRQANRIRLVPRTVIRKLVLDPATKRITHAVGLDRSRPNEPIEFHARQFVVAGGYVWSSHLLLLSAQSGAEQGLANRSGLVGKYLAGHRSVGAQISLPIRLFPGINEQHSLLSKQFMTGTSDFIRHDMRIWESAAGKGARLKNDAGEVMLGSEILEDWRRRTKTGVARVRAYYDVLPDRASELTLDAARKTPWGDPLPKLVFRDAQASIDLRSRTEDKIRSVFGELARAGGGELGRPSTDNFQDHPAGGCRMGNDPATSVVDSWGRAHDHENLFVVGAPTCVSASCANGTLTFCALSLRSAEAIAK